MYYKQSDVIQLLKLYQNSIKFPTDVEIEKNVRGSFGYEPNEGCFEKEESFVKGAEWMRDEIKTQLK